jgi:NAD(P)-dependent dehydrogenase (short-subunit alcohol dehydrogenase family)
MSWSWAATWNGVKRRLPKYAQMVADYGLAGMSLYGSSKAAINLLTKAWAAEYGLKGAA